MIPVDYDCVWNFWRHSIFFRRFISINMGYMELEFARWHAAKLGITLTTDAYGPIVDNAGGNDEYERIGGLVPPAY
jgi:hypothetical protein